MRLKRTAIAGFVFALVACVGLLWRLWPQTPKVVAHAAPLDHSQDRLAAGSLTNKTRQPGPRALDFTTPYTMERLSAEHDRVPTADEWKELTRILLYARDDELVDAVKARFSVHAGAKEMESLIAAYDNPVNDDTRQRIIEIFSTLQSANFPETARRILNDANRPITDQLVCACALSLVRKGEAQDIQALFSRINSAGEDPDPGGSLYSNADGLMYAISEARNPELEQLLMDAAAGRTPAITGRARMAAAAALGNYHTVPVTELLYDLSKNESNEAVRKQAERSLKAIQTNE